MKKTVLRIAAAAMAAAMTLGFSSCGGKAGKSVIASKEHIFSAEKIELPGGLDYINNLLYANEKIFIIGDKSTQEGEGDNVTYTSETKMQILGLDGTLENEIVLAKDDGSDNTEHRYISSMTVDSSGNLISVESSYSWNETTGESKEAWYLVKYGSDGKLISENDLNNVQDTVKKETGNDYFYINNFVAGDDGFLYMSCNDAIAVLDESGKFQYTVKNENSSDNSWMGNLTKTGDGRIVTTITTSRMDGDNYTSETKIYEINAAAKKLGAEYPFSQNGSLMSGTDKYDLLISRDSGLFGYDIETESTETIIDWLKSGFDNTAMNSSCTTVLQDGRILCVTYNYEYNGGGGYSWSNNDQIINILTEVDPSTLPDKKLIKLYALYLDVGIKRQIVEFNKNNPEYEIELTSYEDYATNGYNDAITKLNNDMIAGNLPDIIVLNSNMPIDSYISKGLLADLYEFMDNDETINRSDYIEGVFKAYETNGKLYELISNFNISTLVGKSSMVGDTSGWTVDEFIAFADANPDKSLMGDEISRSDFFSIMVSVCSENFINRDTGECRFDSEDFIKLMEFSTRFPKEIDYNEIYSDENYWNEQQSAYREGRTLLNSFYLNRFGDIRELEQGAFGEPITFKGFPGAAGNGAVFNAYTEIAITSKASNPDGAWNFVKYFLSDEYQDLYTTNNSYQFPIKKSSLEKLAEAAKERPYWEDADGKKEYYDNTYWNGSESINIGVNSDEDNQKNIDFINSTENISRNDEQVSNIINEEASAFFEGQKTSKEVAEIIQNRVSNYLAESR
ncbi:MAG: extracellular solute-binding protein [Oscillospiraceae bacterium]|nr:extracellular solute-binding protein [Oscillospiraceae bacterium]